LQRSDHRKEYASERDDLTRIDYDRPAKKPISLSADGGFPALTNPGKEKRKRGKKGRNERKGLRSIEKRPEGKVDL